MFRPVDVTVHARGANTSKAKNVLQGEVKRVDFVGSHLNYSIEVNSTVINAEGSSWLAAELGARVDIEIPPERIRAMAG